MVFDPAGSVLQEVSKKLGCITLLVSLQKGISIPNWT